MPASVALALMIRVRVDGFVLALAGVVAAATIVPCRGDSADAVHVAAILAIALMFFLQGARLSRDAIVLGMTHWRLHMAIGATTFILFPLIGLGLLVALPDLLPPPLFLGVLFVCALPSTVQSSIALTSIARGNIAGAVCAATVSNFAGIALVPILFGAMSNLRGGGIDLMAIWRVGLQLLVPFAAGHALRPWIGMWAERNRAVLSISDRSSILLVVYSAFSAAVVQGIWQQVPPVHLAMLATLMIVLLGLILVAMRLVSRSLGLSREDEVALVFCGSQKSLVTGVPIANALVSSAAVGPILLPIMLYHPMQLLICAWIARRYAAADARGIGSVMDLPVVDPLQPPVRSFLPPTPP